MRTPFFETKEQEQDFHLSLEARKVAAEIIDELRGWKFSIPEGSDKCNLLSRVIYERVFQSLSRELEKTQAPTSEPPAPSLCGTSPDAPGVGRPGLSGL